MNAIVTTRPDGRRKRRRKLEREKEKMDDEDEDEVREDPRDHFSSNSTESFVKVIIVDSSAVTTAEEENPDISDPERNISARNRS